MTNLLSAILKVHGGLDLEDGMWTHWGTWISQLKFRLVGYCEEGQD